LDALSNDHFTTIGFQDPVIEGFTIILFDSDYHFDFVDGWPRMIITQLRDGWFDATIQQSL
jgi:hypothetical protein